MPIWIPVTVTAALFQCWRTALQQNLRHLLSVNGAGFVRYLYGAPTALLLLLGALTITGAKLPNVTAWTLLWASSGGLIQILATNLLIMAFGFRNFAVGTAYAKTEAAQSAIVAWLLLHETIRPAAIIGMGVGLCGVLTLSLAGRGLKPRDILAGTVQPAALCGLGAGLLFAFTSVFLKLGNQSIAAPNVFVRALMMLLVTNTLQTIMQGAWLAWREPSQLRKAFTTWRSSSLVGTLSACGSAAWLTGFALTQIALVRAVGQIEIVFTLLFSRFYLKETLRKGDIAGLILVVAGVLLIVAES